MARYWPYLVGGALLGLPLAAAAKRGGGGAPKATPEPQERRRQRLFCAFSATGLGDDWLRFLDQTARRESNYRRTASNTSQSEVAASRKAADNVGSVGGVDFDRSTWAFGSRGLFQFLGPYVAVRAGKLRFPASMTVPTMGWDAGVSLAAAIDFARGLMTWNNFAGSWASLNVGWGNPSKMGREDSIAKSAEKMEHRAQKLGWAPGWAMDAPPVVGPQSQSEMRALALVARARYDAC